MSRRPRPIRRAQKCFIGARSFGAYIWAGHQTGAKGSGTSKMLAYWGSLFLTARWLTRNQVFHKNRGWTPPSTRWPACLYERVI